jgi:hypothetical protein
LVGRFKQGVARRDRLIKGKSRIRKRRRTIFEDVRRNIKRKKFKPTGRTMAAKSSLASRKRKARKN